ncbi:hypothetical protein SDC9_211460 [bioreactor metagenome]|uniref:Uncharacterized protein n=1 Tax=bioreactor metagenome TaxID=1076179 RepID=A0A645JJ43_9ZZZZ
MGAAALQLHLERGIGGAEHLEAQPGPVHRLDQGVDPLGDVVHRPVPQRQLAHGPDATPRTALGSLPGPSPEASPGTVSQVRLPGTPPRDVSPGRSQVRPAGDVRAARHNGVRDELPDPPPRRPHGAPGRLRHRSHRAPGRR